MSRDGSDGSGPGSGLTAFLTFGVFAFVAGLIAIPVVAYLISTNGDDGPTKPIPSQSAFYAPLLGYTFDELPAGDLTAIRATIDDAPEMAGVARTVTGHAAVHDATPAAKVIVYELTTAGAARPTVAADIRSAVTRGAKSSEDVSASGEKATYYTRADGSPAAVGVKNGIAVIVLGERALTREQAIQLVTGLLGRVADPK